MPTFRKLTPAEVRTVQGIGPRKAAELEYDEYLREFGPGDSGEAMLAEGEKRMTVMSRLKAAAGRRSPSLKLVFRRTGDANILRFQVIPAPAESVYADVLTQPVGSDTPPAKGGRLRKGRQA